ncbi:hypothetical protein GGQ02_001578 [Salinibacter ruber]|nr:hypothetical protein [Salinibacter ruber]
MVHALVARTVSLPLGNIRWNCHRGPTQLRDWLMLLPLRKSVPQVPLPPKSYRRSFQSRYSARAHMKADSAVCVVNQ